MVCVIIRRRRNEHKDNRLRNYKRTRGQTDTTITFRRRPRWQAGESSFNIVQQHSGRWNYHALNSGIWNQHYLNCEDVPISNIRVYNHCNRNNDGLDIDGCRRVVVSNCIIDSDDDAIVLKSTGKAGCENVVITNCIASSFTNAIKCGTESTGGFRNINIGNCVVKRSISKVPPIFGRTNIGISGISLEIVDGGIMEGVQVHDIVIEETECPVYVRLGNRARKHIPEAPAPPLGTMRNISISNITAYNTGNYTASITGVSAAKIENISLSHLRLVNRAA